MIEGSGNVANTINANVLTTKKNAVNTPTLIDLNATEINRTLKETNVIRKLSEEIKENVDSVESQNLATDQTKRLREKGSLKNHR